jgi:hypothetical protein
MCTGHRRKDFHHAGRVRQGMIYGIARRMSVRVWMTLQLFYFPVSKWQACGFCPSFYQEKYDWTTERCLSSLQVFSLWGTNNGYVWSHVPYIIAFCCLITSEILLYQSDYWGRWHFGKFCLFAMSRDVDKSIRYYIGGFNSISIGYRFFA